MREEGEEGSVLSGEKQSAALGREGKGREGIRVSANARQEDGECLVFFLILFHPICS